MNMAAFEKLVDEALDDLPAWVGDVIDNLAIIVADSPTPEQDPHGEGLLGLYEGVSLADRGLDYFGVMPDTITIFRLPHIHLGLRPDELRDEIRTTVLHEVAHHLGIDDARLHELGWD